MAILDAIESVADSMGASTVRVDAVRCSFLRHRQSKCTACLDACPHGAIRRTQTSLAIDGELCTDCGACAFACPVGAFSTTDPTASEIVRALREDAAGNGGIARVACARAVADADPDELAGVVIPCLNYLDEYLLLGLYAVGVEGVSLLRPECAGCEVGSGACVGQMLSSLGHLARAFGLDLPFELADDLSRMHVAERAPDDGPEDSSRRRGLKELGSAIAGTATREVGERLHLVEAPSPQAADLKKRLPLESYRSPRLLAMARRLSRGPVEPDAVLASRFWKHPAIDGRHCLRCGSCAVFCTTRALTYEETAPGSEKYTLTFHPERCVGCGICADICLTRSMPLGDEVSVRDLLESGKDVLFRAEETRLYRGWGR